MQRFFGKLRKEIVLGAAIAGLGLVFAAGLYRSERAALLERSEGESRQLLAAITEDALSIFQPARAIAETTEDARLTDMDLATAREAFFAIVTGPVRRIKQLSSVYIGFGNGNFWQYREVPPAFVVEHPDAPRGTSSGVRRIIEEKTGANWHMYDEREKSWVPIPEEDSTYDPRTRPWYWAARTESGIQWSEPYKNPTGGEWTLTMSEQLMDRVGSVWGVLGIDFYIDKLGTLLEDWHSRRLLPGAWIGVIDQRSRLIAQAPSDAPEALAKFVTKLNFENPDGLAKFTYEGREYFGSVARLGEEIRLPLSLIVVQPADAILGPAVAALQRNLMLLLAVLAVLVAVATYAIKMREEIKARKIAEAEAKAKDRELALVLDSMTGGLFAVDQALRLRMFNRTFTDDYALGDLRLGMNLEDVFRLRARRGDYGAGEPEMLVKLRLESYTTMQPGEVRLLDDTLPDGRVVAVSRTRVPDGSWVTLFTDITERKRAEAEVLKAKMIADEATKAKSSFLAMMSHEIRTPMNGVMSMAEMLDQTELTDDQRSMSGTIRSSAAALLTIINDILDFSKIEAGKLDIEKVAFSLVETVEGVGELLIPRAEDKGVELIVDLDPSIPDALTGDPTRLRQVALNLAGNAVKFTEEGRVSIVVRAAGAPADGTLVLRFEIRDTGIGLSPEQQSRLFQPFQQADSSTSRKFGGTGLGLSISLKLVEMMGGRIGVESELGKGSTFWFEIPFGATSLAADRPPVDISDAKIVCIDVDGPRREIAGRLLAAAGITGAQFVSSDSFDQAQLAARGPAGILVLGATHGGETALAIARRVLKDPALAGWKPVLVTARSLASTLHEADRAGFFATLTVPVRRHRFWRVLAAALGRADLDARAGSQDVDIGWAPPPLDEALAAGTAILVAEDNATNQLVVARLLNQRGYAHEIVDNGALAAAALEGRNFGLLLTDFHMPEMDGFELTEAVRAREAATGAARLPIVALTADALPGTEEKCLAAGMDGYLTKPIDSKALTATLEKWLPAAKDMRRRPEAKAAASARAPAKPKAAPAIDPAIFERARIEEMFGGWNDEGRDFFVSFLDGVPAMLAKVADALAASDRTGARDAAHALKGAARSMGAVRLGQLASDLQDVLDAEDMDTAGLLQTMLDPTYQELVAATQPIR